MTTEIIRNYHETNLLESEQLQSDRWYIDEDDDTLYAVGDEDGRVSLVYLTDKERVGFMIRPEEVSDLKFREIKASITFSYL